MHAVYCDSGDMRLADGGSESEGRVEICSYGGTWGTVCDSQWTDNHTAVVCRHFGFSDIIGGEFLVMYANIPLPIIVSHVSADLFFALNISRFNLRGFW